MRASLPCPPPRQDLECNELGAAGAESLAGALRSNRSLQRLDLEWNDIRCSGAEKVGGCMGRGRALP